LAEIADGERPLAASHQAAAAFYLNAAVAFQQRSLPARLLTFIMGKNKELLFCVI